MVVDYWKYTKVDLLEYSKTVEHYDGIVSAVVDEVVKFKNFGFQPTNTFIFGYSFGGQVALGVGRDASSKIGGKVDMVHACEPTSLGFPNAPDSKLSGTTVQCIHTDSIYFGTMKRDCHQDWNMGNCGLTQSIMSNTTSHGQCPLYYNSAFTHDFLAIERPTACTVPSQLATYPSGFKMGYMETNRAVTGQLYAKTSPVYPFTA